MESSRVDMGLWAATVAVGGFAVYASLTPEVGGTGPIPDKLAHGILYFVLTALVLLAAVWRPGRAPEEGYRRTAWLGVAAAVGFGALLELGQTFVPERQMEVADLLANSLGALLALAVWSTIRRRAATPPRQLTRKPR